MDDENGLMLDSTSLLHVIAPFVFPFEKAEDVAAAAAWPTV
jgi:hypothetical protein